MKTKLNSISVLIIGILSILAIDPNLLLHQIGYDSICGQIIPPGLEEWIQLFMDMLLLLLFIGGLVDIAQKYLIEIGDSNNSKNYIELYELPAMDLFPRVTIPQAIGGMIVWIALLQALGFLLAGDANTFDCFHPSLL